MLKPINPPSIASPFSHYSQAVEASAGLRWLHISGQVGVRPDGTIEQGFPAQAERAWDNVLSILATAGMGPADLVKVNIYLNSRWRRRRTRAASARQSSPAPRRPRRWPWSPRWPAPNGCSRSMRSPPRPEQRGRALSSAPLAPWKSKPANSLAARSSRTAKSCRTRCTAPLMCEYET